MAAGKPVLMAVKGDAADLVCRARGGLCTEPGNPAALARTVMKFAEMPASELEQMGGRGQAWYRGELSLRIGVEQFIGVFKEAMEKNARQDELSTGRVVQDRQRSKRAH